MSKTLDRISALLSKAESTDSEAERDALLSKAQELATLSAIDLEVARQHQRNRTLREAPVQSIYRFFQYAKGARNRPILVSLASALSEANDLKMDIYSDSSGVILYGFPSDVEVFEALFASIRVQMNVAVESFLKSKSYREEMSRDVYGNQKPVDGRTARRSFLESFVYSVSTRLRKARKDALASQEGSEVTVVNDAGDEVSRSTSLVLVGKRDEIAATYSKMSNAKGSYRPAGHASYSNLSANAGVAAGNNARLGATRGIANSRGISA